MKKLLALLGVVAVAAPAWAATRTVTLAVPGMDCATCPITVRKALSNVEGVSKIEVKLEKREVVVTFDDAKTDVRQLTGATGNAGYPSEAKQ